MSTQFNANEILAVAEQIERNGASFYRRAAEGMEDESHDMLLELAEMEDEHEKTFARMRADLPGQDWAEPHDPTGEAELYLQSFAAGYVFDLNADPLERLAGAKSLKSILRAAIGLEKDSIVFYVGIREAVPQGLGRGKVSDIISEEMSHVRILSDHLEKVRD